MDGLLAQIRLRVGGQLLTAVITADAVHALRLKRGDEALAVIKSTEVMIARGAAARPGPPPRAPVYLAAATSTGVERYRSGNIRFRSSSLGRS